MSEITYDFEEFKKILDERIREYLPEEYQNGIIQFQEVRKSGLGQMTGMTIRTPEESVASCMYIDSAFREHQKYGMPIDQIAASLGSMFCKIMTEKLTLQEDSNLRALISCGFDWDTVKENCFLHAVPASNNISYLQEMPHRVQGDIAAVYKINLGESETGRMLVGITNDLAQRFGISEKDLFQVSIQNMMEKDPPHIGSMESYMMSMMAGEKPLFQNTFQEELKQIPEMLNDECKTPFSILTNNEIMNGAAVVFSQEVMDGLAGKYPDGFYILPSSIHETIILAKSDKGMTLKAMNEMVKEINRTEVSPQERLSDYVHEYDPVSRSLYIAGTAAPSQKIKAELQESKATAHKR